MQITCCRCIWQHVDIVVCSCSYKHFCFITEVFPIILSIFEVCCYSVASNMLQKSLATCFMLFYFDYFVIQKLKVVLFSNEFLFLLFSINFHFVFPIVFLPLLFLFLSLTTCFLKYQQHVDIVVSCFLFHFDYFVMQKLKFVPFSNDFL